MLSTRLSVSTGFDADTLSQAGQLSVAPTHAGWCGVLGAADAWHLSSLPRKSHSLSGKNWLCRGDGKAKNNRPTPFPPFDHLCYPPAVPRKAPYVFTHGRVKVICQAQRMNFLDICLNLFFSWSNLFWGERAVLQMEGRGLRRQELFHQNLHSFITSSFSPPTSACWLKGWNKTTYQGCLKSLISLQFVFHPLNL